MSTHVRSSISATRGALMLDPLYKTQTKHKTPTHNEGNNKQ